MKKLHMVDLVSQYQRLQNEIDNNLQDVLNSGTFINGPAVKDFEKHLSAYLGGTEVIPCANGTDALQIALMALELAPGDEVITADFTFAATVEVIHLLGLKSVLVDVDADSYTLNLEEVEKAITPKTKVIIPVHLFGQCADMESIMQLAEKHGLTVVEDTAQAIGADYTFSNGTKKKAGTIGTIGTTSFFPSKNLGCFGDGGAIFTHDKNLAHKLRGIVNHGMYKRYYHDEVGVNSRLDSLQAAILDVKLPHLDDFNTRRQKVAQYYNTAFEGIEALETPKEMDYSTHVYHQYTLRVTNGKRDELKAYLDEMGIPNAVYYPVALHHQKAYQAAHNPHDNFPVTNHLTEEVISLPIHTEFEEDQLEFITQKVKQFFEK